MKSTSSTIARLISGFYLTLLLSGCSVNVENVANTVQVAGSGVSKTESRDVEDFNAVSLGNALTLDLTIGEATSLEVTADDNLLPHVVTKVVDGRLNISVDASYSTKLGIKVKATTSTLNSLQTSGASKSTISGVKEDQFHLEVSGASTNSFSGDAEQLNVKVSGASKCHFQGTTKQVELDISGASNTELRGKTDKLVVRAGGASAVKATELIADSADITAHGASTVHVNAAQELKARATTASKIRYSGAPAKTDNVVTGASTIKSE